MTRLKHVPPFAGHRPVARLCLGTMTFGARTDDDEAGRILETYFAAGGNFVDTADSYAGGESERMLGRLLKDRRQDVVLATKVGNPTPDTDGSSGLAGDRIRRAAEHSLKRLQTERIALYYLHLEDPTVPLEETVAAVGALEREGLIGAWGFSNFRPWKIAEMVRLADELGVARPRVAQPYYHLLNRRIEADYLPACRHFGIGVVSYSALARGVLTGKYRDGTPADSRAALGDKRMIETEFFPATLELANQVTDYATETGRTPSALALNWVLANDAVHAALVGPRTHEQLVGYLEAYDTAYTAADEEMLSGLCPAGHSSPPGHNDPRYPMDGRHTAFATGPADHE